MKTIKFTSLIFTILLSLLAFSVVSAQEEPENDEMPVQRRARPFRIMQELGLTREQVQQIRRINQERRPVMQEAARRWRAASRELDTAIYSDDSNEEQVKELLRSAQNAQAELLKERTLTEFLIRQVLTPEQLVKFRGLRQQLMRNRFEDRKNVDNQSEQETPPQRPFNRFRQRRNQNRQP